MKSLIQETTIVAIVAFFVGFILESLNIPNVISKAIIFLFVPLIVHVLFLYVKLSRKQDSEPQSIVSLIVATLIDLANGLLPFAIVIAFAVTIAFPSISQTTFIIFLITGIPLRILFYRRRLPMYAGIAPMVLDDLAGWGVMVVPLILLILLIPAIESPLYRLMMALIILVYSMIFMAARYVSARQVYMTNDYQAWSRSFLATKASSLGIPVNDGDVYAVLVNFGVKKKLETGSKIYVISVSTNLRGWTQVKSSLGAGITHPDPLMAISGVALEILERANTVLKKTNKAKDIRAPLAGGMTIYFLTSSGLRSLILPAGGTDSTDYIAKRARQIIDYANILLQQGGQDLNEQNPVNPVATTSGHPLQ